jgi:hypothetical protein
MIILYYQLITLGELFYNERKIAAPSTKCSIVYLPAIVICNTPITLPRSAS